MHSIIICNERKRKGKKERNKKFGPAGRSLHTDADADSSVFYLIFRIEILLLQQQQQQQS